MRPFFIPVPCINKLGSRRSRGVYSPNIWLTAFRASPQLLSLAIFLFPTPPSSYVLFASTPANMAPMAKEPGQKGVNWSNIAVGEFAHDMHALLGTDGITFRRDHEHGVMLFACTFQTTNASANSGLN